MSRRTEPSLDLALCRRVAQTCPGIALRTATREVEQAFAGCFADVPINQRQFSLMVALSLAAPCSMARLVEVTGLNAATLSRNLDVLERDGLVQSTDGGDRRARVLQLSEQGTRALQRALVGWQAAMESLERLVGSKNLKEVTGSLRSLSQAMRSDER